MQLLTERHSDPIDGVLSCYDRVLVQGTLPTFCYAKGMTGYLYAQRIRIFDYPRFAQPLRDPLQANAERLASENGLSIEYIRKLNFRKEDRVRARLRERGTQPGLICIFSALERCSTYQPWHDKKTGKTFLRPHDGKCLHYYFYFLDEDLGLVFVRVPTWCPFRLQIYFNGHEWLASQLRRQGIAYQLVDNAFVEIADWTRAQQLADAWSMKALHEKFDAFARRYCPILVALGFTYHWSLDQVEYSTDLVFRNRQDLQPLYEALTRTAIHTVKPQNIATFLSRKFSRGYNGEMGNQFQTRIEGTRIKHLMGPVSLKMYDKFGHILRLETTVNDVSFFQHYRPVEQRKGQRLIRWAPMKKSIYSLPALRELRVAANRRYLEFLSALEDPRPGLDKLQRLCQTLRQQERSYPGFNFFAPHDLHLFETLGRGEYNLYGFQNKDLRQHLPAKSSGQISRLLKRLRLHGLLKRVPHNYKYYLTSFGKQVLAAGLKLRNLVLIPQLALTPTPS